VYSLHLLLWRAKLLLATCATLALAYLPRSVTRGFGAYVRLVIEVVKVVITDRGSEFCNKFCDAVCRAVGTIHSKSTAYHPPTNGQSERMNRVLEDMLRHYVNPRQE